MASFTAITSPHQWQTAAFLNEIVTAAQERSLLVSGATIGTLADVARGDGIQSFVRKMQQIIVDLIGSHATNRRFARVHSGGTKITLAGKRDWGGYIDDITGNWVDRDHFYTSVEQIFSDMGCTHGHFRRKTDAGTWTEGMQVYGGSAPDRIVKENFEDIHTCMKALIATWSSQRIGGDFYDTHYQTWQGVGSTPAAARAAMAVTASGTNALGQAANDGRWASLTYDAFYEEYTMTAGERGSPVWFRNWYEGPEPTTNPVKPDAFMYWYCQRYPSEFLAHGSDVDNYAFYPILAIPEIERNYGTNWYRHTTANLLPTYGADTWDTPATTGSTQRGFQFSRENEHMAIFDYSGLLAYA